MSEPKITGEVRWEWVPDVQKLVRSWIPLDAKKSKNAALHHIADTADTLLFCVADYMREQGFDDAAFLSAAKGAYAAALERDAERLGSVPKGQRS